MLCIRNSWKFDYRILLFMKVELLNEESKTTPRLRKLSIYCIGKLSKKFTLDIFRNIKSHAY